MYLWELPRSSQDSPERCDLTFSVWEGSLIGGPGKAKEFHGIFSSVDPLYFSITLL